MKLFVYGILSVEFSVSLENDRKSILCWYINLALDEYPSMAKKLKTPTYNYLFPRKCGLFGKEKKRYDYKHTITAWDLGRDFGYINWDSPDWLFISEDGTIYNRYADIISRDEAIEEVYNMIEFCQVILSDPKYNLPNKPGEELLAVKEFFSRSLFGEINKR